MSTEEILCVTDTKVRLGYSVLIFLRISFSYNHSLVTGSLKLKFYAAFPLKTNDGYLIGTLSVLDMLAGTLNDKQIRILHDFTDTVMDLLELRLTARAAISRQRHLLNMAVHDLKNPLTNISIRAQLIERKKNDLQSVSKLALQITETSKQIITQVADLLKSGKEISDEVIYYREVDLEQIIRKVATSFSPQADYKQQQIILEISARSKVLGDELQPTEIIDNLVSNAIKYCYPGGNILIKLYQVTGIAIISISDDGPGFTSEDYNKMFQRFAQLSAKPTGEESSSGLGLSIVLQLVEQHGGRVSATQNPKGTGAMMIVELPIYNANNFTMSNAIDESLNKSKGKRNSSTKLYTHQLLIEVLAIMHSTGIYTLPAYHNNVSVDVVSITEILKFLRYEPEKNIVMHKLCYALDSFLELKNSI